MPPDWSVNAVNSGQAGGRWLSFIALNKECLEFLEKRRQMGLHGFPDNLEIDVAVVMHNPIAHADNLMEGDVWELSASVGGEAARRFSRDEKTPQDSILRLAICKELLARLSCDVIPNGFQRPENIEQVGTLPRWNRFHKSMQELTGDE